MPLIRITILLKTDDKYTYKESGMAFRNRYKPGQILVGKHVKSHKDLFGEIITYEWGKPGTRSKALADKFGQVVFGDKSEPRNPCGSIK